MKITLLALFSLISFAAPLTTAQLDQVRQRVAVSGVPITFTKVDINAAAQSTQTWIEANRGSLPNQVTAAGLTGAQVTAYRASFFTTFTNAQIVAVFNAVGAYHEIVVPPPPDPLDPQSVIALDALLSLISAQLDISHPGMTRIQKLRAFKLALEKL